MTEKRYDIPRKEIKRSDGTIKVREASHTIYYYGADRREIAWYSSKDDTLYLNTRCIKGKHPQPYPERIAGSKYEAEYTELLGRYQNVSEYMNA